jgi:glycosyltransferase involved in cell wall biosynthesis
MKFVALLPVRDEADVIGECLDHMLAWVDAVYVFDTGSEDQTWEIVNDAAAKDRRVKPMRKDAVFFSETWLRGWMFHQARGELQNGDWFLRADADEFHHVPPPEFVKTRLRRHETVVYHQYYNFCLRESEVRDWEAGRETLADRRRPIAARRRWYLPSVYSEPRLCRYRRTMQWPPSVSFPYNAGYLAVERLPIRHYPHRDPLQLARRCRLRAAMMADATNGQTWTRPDMHWAIDQWRAFITRDDHPELRHWLPGAELPELRHVQHLARPPVRAVQRLVHSLLVPALDRRRAAWPDDAYPQRIPPHVAEKLRAALSLTEA